MADTKQSVVGPAVRLPEKPVIAVVGAGGVGGYYGGRLAEKGYEVHFLLRSDYEVVKREGWRIKSCVGDFWLRPGEVKVYRDVREMPRADLVVVTLKTTNDGLYEPLVGPLLKGNTAIFSIQNGLGPDEKLAALFGAERVIGGLAFVCINRTEAGVIHHMDHGMIKLGEFGGGASPRSEQVMGMLRESKIPCEVLADLHAGRWEKLIWNVPFNGLGAALDLTTDKLIGTDHGRDLVAALMREIVAGAQANGVTFRKPGEEIIRGLIDATATMGPYRSSMQVDRQERRALEVEAILGEPCRRAEAKGVKVPWVRALYELARVVDEGACR